MTLAACSTVLLGGAAFLRRSEMPELASAETRIVLENVRWETFLELAEGRPVSVPRMTFYH